ncbi:MAG TPA: hypothetical protein PL070_18195, partial [Flavobacteriales bacterium]|nr:hypothetical protein [Flavobacteriales bacterium]
GGQRSGKVLCPTDIRIAIDKALTVKKVLLLLLLPFAILVACTKDDLEHGAVAELHSDRLNLDVSTFPLPTLSAYGFFKGKMVNQQPMRGVVPYEPINALFTDYAHKFRFVCLPVPKPPTAQTMICLTSPTEPY